MSMIKDNATQLSASLNLLIGESSKAVASTFAASGILKLDSMNLQRDVVPVCKLTTLNPCLRWSLESKLDVATLCLDELVPAAHSLKNYLSLSEGACRSLPCKSTLGVAGKSKIWHAERSKRCIFQFSCLGVKNIAQEASAMQTPRLHAAAAAAGC